MTKPKITLVRGSSLNSWEMQNFALLTNNFDLQGVGTHQIHYDTELIRFPVVRSRAWSDFKKWLGPLGASKLGAKFGDRYLNLAPVLRGSAIVHSAETFNPYSEQVVQLKDRLGYKVVLTVWENIPFLWDGVGGNSEKIHRRKQQVISKTDRFLAVTERARQALLVEGVDPERITVFPMGIDIKRFSPHPRNVDLLKRFGISSDAKIVLSVGHLSWYKGMQELIFAAAKLQREGFVQQENLHFLIVGRGDERVTLRNLIHRSGVEDIVTMVEHIPYEEMVDVHNLADIFYLGSWPAVVWQEQLGMVLLESMACSKAVIAAESGSISEIVGGVARLIPPADFVRLSETIIELIQRPHQREEMGQRGRELVQRRFDHQVVAKNLLELYQSLL